MEKKLDKFKKNLKKEKEIQESVKNNNLIRIGDKLNKRMKIMNEEKKKQKMEKMEMKTDKKKINIEKEKYKKIEDENKILQQMVDNLSMLVEPDIERSESEIEQSETNEIEHKSKIETLKKLVSTYKKGCQKYEGYTNMLEKFICCICFDNPIQIVLACGHTYCEDCQKQLGGNCAMCGAEKKSIKIITNFK